MAVMCLLAAGCGEVSRGHREGEIPRELLLAARPIGHGPRFHPPARGPVIGACARRLGRRFPVHLELFAANRVVLVARGIGARRPFRLTGGRIVGAHCYGSVVTLEPTGVVLVRLGERLTVGDVFRGWGEQLSRRRLAGFSGRSGVRAYVGGVPWHAAPSAIPLHEHAEIVLEVGPYVPPHRAYNFPPLPG